MPIQAQADAPQQGSPPRPEGPGEAAERRQLTILFCDLVGSTALSTVLDPEELRHLIQVYHAACDEVIQRYDGHIAQYLGDGVMVYFGYPLAHEDDAQRAIHAGLGIIEAMAELNDRLAVDTGVRLEVRLAAHTGLVVMGEVGGSNHGERLALGAAPNVSAKIQGLAQPGTMLTSPSTYRLVREHFDCQALGPRAIQGVAEPMELYQVLGASAARRLGEFSGHDGLPPIVGRDSELELLWERWEHSKEGEGQFVLISGEAGIGKSRLVKEFQDRVVSQGAVRFIFRCSPYNINSAFYPIIMHMQSISGFARDDSPEAKLEKLEQVLADYSLPMDRVVPLFASLLSLPAPGGYADLGLTPERQKQETQDWMITWLLEVAGRQPLLVVWEDLHWADPSTLELLGLFMDHAPAASILTILTYRPQFQPPWPIRSHVGHLVLNRLTRGQVENMAQRLAGEKQLPGQVYQLVVDKADGVPLFVEELIKYILESGLVEENNGGYEIRGTLPEVAVPATLQDLLMARLDRLAAAKEVAQLGATLGRDFPYELIEAISPLSEHDLQENLRQLVDAELLYQRGRPPNANYIFKHIMVQEVAYQSLLRTTRQEYHRQIAEVLADRFPATVESRPEVLARHYTEAGLIEQAVSYWHKAGQMASTRAAFAEAMNHLTKGLELLNTVPVSAQRDGYELELQTTLGHALIATKGYSDPDVERTFARALELCHQIGENIQLFAVLWGLWAFYMVRADFQQSQELGNDLITLAEGEQDTDLLLEAYTARGMNCFWTGDLLAARANFERALSLYDLEQHRSHALAYLQDPGVSCLSHLSWILWILGYPEQALKRNDEAAKLSRELSYPNITGFCQAFSGVFHQISRDPLAAREQADAVIALSAEHGFPNWYADGEMIRGWLTAQGNLDEAGIVELRRGIDTWEAIGARLWRTHQLGLLAEAYGSIGQPEKGLSAVDDSLDLVELRGEDYYEAELRRLKGELLLKQPLPSGVEAEKCFLEAINLARNKDAKGWELRATTSLSRLWLKHGKSGEARRMLAEVYGWFEEGLESPDLKEAAALLDQLQ